MEREITFRGKGEFTGEWIEGYYGKVGEKGYIFTGKVVANNHLNDYGSTCFGLERYAVDPATVGQYTGLMDRNGKKIFEGDVLRFANNDGDVTLYIVAWDTWSAAWGISYLDEDFLGEERDHMAGWEPEEWEIAGNRLDNPELLEVKI